MCKIVKTNNSEQLLKETKENKQKTPCNILLPKKSKKYSNFSFWNGANRTMFAKSTWISPLLQCSAFVHPRPDLRQPLSDTSGRIPRRLSGTRNDKSALCSTRPHYIVIIPDSMKKSNVFFSQWIFPSVYSEIDVERSYLISVELLGSIE